MTIPYGSYPNNGPSTGGYAPTYKVRFEWISEAWSLFSRDAGIWVGAVLIYGVVQWIVSFIAGLVTGGSGAILTDMMLHPNQPNAAWRTTPQSGSALSSIISVFISWIMGSFQTASLTSMAVKQLRGQRLQFSDAFAGGPYFAAMFVLTLLTGLLSVLGIMAVCVGLFVVMGLLMAAPALAADGEPPLDAISRSFAGMKNDWGMAALFVLVWGFVMVLSAVPCYLGLLATVPMHYLIGAIAYRDMVGMPGALPPYAMGYFPGMPSYEQPQPGQWPPPPTQAPFGGSYGQSSPYGNPPGTPPPYGQPGQMPQSGPAQPPPPYGAPSGPSFGQSPQPGSPQPPPSPWQPPQQGAGQPPQSAGQPPLPPSQPLPPQSPWQPPQQGPGQPPQDPS